MRQTPELKAAQLLLDRVGLQAAIRLLQGLAKEDPAPPSFDEVFQKLDQRKGYGVVSLVDLRKEMCLPREQFDRLIAELRRSYRYSLSGVEGRHGITEEQREAAIPEGDRLLLFVSRR